MATNTVLITGDSILNNLQENRLNRNFNVKVRCFPGADMDDMFDFITPRHLGTLSCILERTMQLKSYQLIY